MDLEERSWKESTSVPKCVSPNTGWRRMKPLMRLTTSKRLDMISSSSFLNISKKSRCLHTHTTSANYSLLQAGLTLLQHLWMELHFCSKLRAVSLFTCPGWRFHVRAVCQWSVGCPTSETHNVNGSGIPDWSENTWNPSGNHHHRNHTVADQNKSKTGSWSTLEPRPPHQMSPLYSVWLKLHSSQQKSYECRIWSLSHCERNSELLGLHRKTSWSGDKCLDQNSKVRSLLFGCSGQ